MLTFDRTAMSAMNPQVAASALEELNTIYLITDKDLYITAAGPRLLSRFFIPPGQVVEGEALVTVVPELSGMEQELSAVIDGNRARYELRRVNRAVNGDLFYIDVVAFPYHGADGQNQPDGLLVLLSDVTRTSRLEQQVTQQRNELQLAQAAVARRNRRLSETNHRLNQLLEERSSFFKMAVHDLKSPLYCIIGYADLLTDPMSDPLTEEQRIYIETMRKQAEVTSQIVEDLLEVERIESGISQLTPSLLDLYPVISQAISLIEVQASQRGVTVKWSGPSTSLSAFADVAALERILSNLLSNAVKYSDHGGTVRVGAVVEGDVVRVEVADEGMGIHPEDQEKVFQRFYRTQTARESGAAGTGLGLSIVQALVQQLGGKVGCTSEPGSGSVFWFTVPRIPPGRD